MKWNDMVRLVMAAYDRDGSQAAASEVLRLSAAHRLTSSQESALSEAAIGELRSRHPKEGREDG